MSKQILILDDDADFNTLLTDVFTQADYDVTSAHDPEEALIYFKEKDFDLVVTDHRMPILTGAEFIKEIKGIRTDIPVVMVSGYLDNETIRELIQQGVGGVFLKPLNIFSLLKKTAELLKKSEEKARDGGGSGQTRSPIGTDFKHNLPFECSAFPCKSAASAQFEKNLYALRDFKANLLLIGEAGSNFEGICEDIHGFSKGGKEVMLTIQQDSFSEHALHQELIAAENSGATGITLIILRTEELTAEVKKAIFAISKREPPFDTIGIWTRFVFCMNQDLDTLYDKGQLDENLYIFLGTSELNVPTLADCQEDIVLMANSIMQEEMERLGLSDIELHYEAKNYLEELRGPANYQDLKDTIIAALQIDNISSITEEDLRYAFEYKGRRVSTKRFATLEMHLQRLRNEYVRAVSLFCENDNGKAAEAMGISAEVVEQITSSSEDF